MTPQEWEAMLRRTAEDRRLSAPERTALADRLAGATEQQVAAFRARAFDVLREETFSPRQQELLVWLEDLIKLLHPVRAGGPASEALFTPHDDLCGRLTALFLAARHSVDVCVFTITDDRITEAILKAHGRGVRLRIVTDDMKSLDLGADVTRLEEAGVPVLMDRTEAHMHHKFAVFDRTLLVNGSYNWTRSAQSANSENIVVTAEKRLVDLFGRYFDRLWTQLGGGR
jgi:cardiolipin hydrolase